jgi:hypothetical protein
MIIDLEKKYLFVGLPYSASSAISKELIEQYGGEPLYHKHANIPLLLKHRPDIEIDQFFIFAVVRDPVEITFSIYNKYLTNPYNIYTDSKYFIENGGFVSRKARRMHHTVHGNKLTFEEYINHIYRHKPYDNDLSLNARYLTDFIDFNNITEDFRSCLVNIGIDPVRQLPLYNKTNKVTNESPLPLGTVRKVFGPFYRCHADYFHKNIRISLARTSYFRLLQAFRYYKRLKYDERQKASTQSIIDLKNPR